MLRNELVSCNTLMFSVNVFLKTLTRKTNFKYFRLDFYGASFTVFINEAG